MLREGTYKGSWHVMIYNRISEISLKNRAESKTAPGKLHVITLRAKLKIITLM
jgi:hypothetical protein